MFKFERVWFLSPHPLLLGCISLEQESVWAKIYEQKVLGGSGWAWGLEEPAVAAASGVPHDVQLAWTSAVLLETTSPPCSKTGCVFGKPWRVGPSPAGMEEVFPSCRHSAAVSLPPREAQAAHLCSATGGTGRGWSPDFLPAPRLQFCSRRHGQGRGCSGLPDSQPPRFWSLVPLWLGCRG